MDFEKYRRKALSEMRPITQEEVDRGLEALQSSRVSVSQSDIENGSPK